MQDKQQINEKSRETDQSKERREREREIKSTCKEESMSFDRTELKHSPLYLAFDLLKLPFDCMVLRTHKREQDESHHSPSYYQEDKEP